MANPLPTLFLSYSWANQAHADELDTFFKTIGIIPERDIRDVEFRSSIKQFMHRVRNSDYVLMIISDEYIKSKNCMYEVTELLNTHEFRERVIPIVIDNARRILNARDRSVYYDHWNEEVNRAMELKKQYMNHDYVELSKQCTDIQNKLDDFFGNLTDLNVKSQQQLKENNYRDILKLIGFEERSIKDKVKAIGKIKDIEEREIAIDQLLQLYPDDKQILSEKASIACSNGKFKIARHCLDILLQKYPHYTDTYAGLAELAMYINDFEDAKSNNLKAIALDPGNAVAHCNLAFVLESRLGEYEDAKKHYELSLKLDPESAASHYNYAYLLATQFSEYLLAEKHYLKSIELEPDQIMTHEAYADLLEKNLNNAGKARIHFEKCLLLEPQNAYIHHRLGDLMDSKFVEAEEIAKKHYLEAIKIDPNIGATHNNYASLLKNKFKDYVTAEYHYKEALRVEPDNSVFHSEYADLLNLNLGRYEEGKRQLEISVELEPNSHMVRQSLAYVLSHHFGEYDRAKQQLEMAIKIAPDFPMHYFSMGHLLFEHYHDYVGARKNFEKCLSLYQYYPDGNHNLAWLLSEHFNDNEGAKALYRKELAFEPNAITHRNFADLLHFKIGETDEARKQYEESLRLDWQDAATHNNFAILLINAFNDKEKAKMHYLIATSLESQVIDPDVDRFLGIKR